MREQLLALKEAFYASLEELDTQEKLEALRIQYLGKNGDLRQILKQMGKLSKEERPIMGELANELRDGMTEAIRLKAEEMEMLQIEQRLEEERVDISLPGEKYTMGRVHPTTKTIRELIDIFVRMGFVLEEGPEVETVYHNFDALNSPKDHPSREMSDTFYFDASRVLRTHTSPVQVRTMKKMQPPIRMISVGRCFRNDEIDATHSPMFYQMEGLVVGEKISMADLKGTLEEFVRQLFGEDTLSVFRPHNFPFTEPSAEVDISCFKCHGKGCRFCGHTGFIEILGCGMVHPEVLEECGIDSETYTGFAFGMGLDRITMMRYEIDDIRYLYENDRRFLDQFRR